MPSSSSRSPPSSSTVASLDQGRRSSSSRSKRSSRSFVKTIEIDRSADECNTIVSDLTTNTEISKITNASAILATRKSLRKSIRERTKELKCKDSWFTAPLKSDGSSVGIFGTNSHPMKVIRHVQKRRYILITIAFTSAIFLPIIANQSLRNFSVPGENAQEERNLRSQVDMMSNDEAIDVGTYFEQREDDINDIELLIHRKLADAFVEEQDFEGFVMPEDLENQLGTLGHANSHNESKIENKSAQSGQTRSNRGSRESAIRPYNLTDVLYAADIYENAFVTLVWDPNHDLFISYYSQRHYWSGCEKLLASIKQMTYMLKHLFPWRFQQGKSAEFAMADSAGDHPGVKVTDCVLGHSSEPCAHTAPILHFGSVFRKPIFPNMIAMPMPDGHHLKCFENWVRSKDICTGLRGVEDGGQLFFGESIGKSFEDLIPQVVWRGSEFGYLGKFFTDLKHPAYAHIEGNIDPKTTKLNSAVHALRSMYGDLVPRWQGVVHTAEAEIEANKTSLPWANIKFSHYMENGHKTEAVGSKGFEKWEEINFPAAGERMSSKEQAHYKYHIDLGGGGGTTWSGTIIKLAMPGLLFHHVTPTKDYIHDRMRPWTHYIPVRADLRDLKRKFNWAESHPEIAAKIARQGTKLVRKLGTPEGFEQMFKEEFEEPLRKMIAAYQPSGRYHWRRVMKEVEGDLLKPIMACTGVGIHEHSCPRLVGTGPFKGKARRAPPRST